MDVRHAARPALLLATLALGLGSAAAARAAGDGTPTPLSLDQATALATATPAVPSGTSTSIVDGSTALDAASQPGAQTSIESDISPQAAVGLAPLSDADVLSAAKPTCWANYVWHQWGTWPYEQRVTDTTYWCAVFANHITYRTSTTTASGTLCGVSWRAGALVGGGIGRGFTFFTNESSAGFSCQTVVPWITLHTTHHQDIKRTDRGATSTARTG